MVKPIVLLGKVVFVRERLGRLVVSYSLWRTTQTMWGSCDIIIASNHCQPLTFVAWVSARLVSLCPAGSLRTQTYP